MKKLVLLTLIIAVFAGALTSCGGEDTVYYGVAEFSKEHNGIFVNIPNVGLCEIPESGKISSELDGVSRSTVRAGDLIRMNFGKNEDVALMESYPARFSAECEEITICAVDIDVEFEYMGTTPVCYLTEKTPAGISNAVIGDFIAFYEGGDTIDDVYCYGEVYMTFNDGRIVIKLELVNGISEFLSKYPRSFEQKIVEMN